MTAYIYGEDLPSECPPESAIDGPLIEVYRLIAESQPSENFFASKLITDGERPDTYKCSDCEWASCSLNYSLEALLKIRGLRKRNKFVAKLDIPANSGRHIGDGHVHFWKYQEFSISSAVIDVWEHGK